MSDRAYFGCLTLLIIGAAVAVVLLFLASKSYEQDMLQMAKACRAAGGEWIEVSARNFKCLEPKP